MGRDESLAGFGLEIGEVSGDVTTLSPLTAKLLLQHLEAAIATGEDPPEDASPLMITAHRIAELFAEETMAWQPLQKVASGAA